MKTLQKISLFLLMAVLLAHTHRAHAQPGSLDATFTQTGTGFNSVVRCSVVQPDGKVIVGGDFSQYNGTFRRCIARLNADGTIDATFVGAIDGSGSPRVYALALQSDGKMIVCGKFDRYFGGVSGSNSGIIRLNADGTLDNTFTVGTGFTGSNNDVRALALQSDGKVIAGGEFSLYNGTGRNNIARLNADGTLDNTFTAGTGFPGTVLSFALQSDGKVIVGGVFDRYNGGAPGSNNKIARLNANGTLDNTFTVGTGFLPGGGEVSALALQSDGKVIVGGFLTQYNGTGSNNRIARLNSNGTIDNTFTVGTGFPGGSDGVYALALQSDGKVIVGGFLTQYNGTGSNNHIARLNADGTIDNTFTVGTGFNSVGVNALTLQSDGKVLVGGSFTSYNGTARNRFVRLNVSPLFQGITSFTPTSGGAGTTVVITGVGFTGATAVSFGGIPAASFTVNSNTQITAVVGSSSTTTGGPQAVTVTASGGTFSLGGFSIGATAQSGGTTPSGSTTQPSAVISGFSPQQFGFGTPITLSGFGFTGATGLLIGGVAATNFVVVNDNTITAVVGGVPLTDRILISGGAGASLDMSGLGLTYLRLPAPSIASISPASLIASGDDASLTLRGFYLMAGARAQVSERVANGTFLQPVSIGVQSLNATQAVVTLSGIFRSPGAKMVTMVNPDGQTASVMLTVITGAAVRLADNGGTPLVFSTTASGRAFSVRLSGTNIFRTVQAFVGNVQARVTVPSSTEAIVEVPASVNESGGTSLTLRLTNTDGQSTTATLRIERRPPPTIMGVTLQNDGRLRVRGVNFLGGIRAALSNSALTVLSQESDVEFVAQIPPSFRLTANTPTVSLTVENPDGRAHGVLLPRSFFEGNGGASAGGATASERTWESGSSGMDMAEIASGKQLNVLQTASRNASQSASQELRVYPNPIESELRISGVGQRTVRLYDMRGGVALEERTASGVVNVQALSAGAYMVVVESADGHVLRQRVVKR